MTITIHNYLSEINQYGIEKLPETLRKGHDLVMKTSQQGTNWATYESRENIRNVVNLYFQKLSEYLSSRTGRKTKNKVVTESETESLPEHAIKKSETAKRKINEKSKPKAKQKTTLSSSGKLVEHIREEIKFIKRYVGLHNKVKSPRTILAFIKALQRAIIQKLIRKSSPLASEIVMIQDKLIQTYSKMKGDESFAINEKDLSRLVVLAGGEQVYPSINVIKRFIGMQGKFMEEKKADAFARFLEKAVKDKKITKDDPYADKVNAIYQAMTKRTGSTVSLTKTELNGLEGIVKACSCASKTMTPLSGYDDGLNNGLSPTDTAQVLTAQQMANRKFDLLNFSSVWHSLLGRPAKNFAMMFHGEPNNGKTTFLLKFGQYLANTFGEVLYVSSEEFASYTMTQKVNELLVPLPSRLHFSENLDAPEIGHYDFVILDSVNDLGLRVDDYKALRKANPDVSFILVLQHTKDGKFKGGKDWEHMVEIVGEVANGIVTITKSRYAPKTSVDFFEYLNTDEKQLLAK